MTSAVDICNLALSEMGGRTKINSLSDPTPQAFNCNIWYDRLRKQLIRSAPWGFARATIVLTPTGSILDNPPDNQYPFLFNYAYPPDCLKIRYLLQPPPPTSSVVPPVPGEPLIWYPWMMPRRDWRFVETLINGQKTLLANIQGAWAVYNQDVQDPNQFDELFVDALSMALADKLVIPLSGNIQMKGGFRQMAVEAINRARIADGNEAMPTTEHTPDWIMVRGLPSLAAFQGTPMVGNWIADWNNGGYGD